MTDTAVSTNTGMPIGVVKNLHGPDGKRSATYRINAAFFSARGKGRRKLRLARAIRMIMPDIPPPWYPDLFSGKNDCATAMNADLRDHGFRITREDAGRGAQVTSCR